jgi:hypothetical protein
VGRPVNIFFAGGENPTQRKRLIEHKVEHICVSFYGWQAAHSSDNLAKVFPDDVKLVLTAGISRQKSLDWAEFALNYLDFIEHNIDRIEWVYEIDSQHCPIETRNHMRKAIETIPGVVMVPQHNEPQQLALTAAKYERVAVNATVSKRCEARDLRRVQATLFGSNVLNQRVLTAGRIPVTTTMAWLSPRRYGEMLLYTRTGKLLHIETAHRLRAIEQYKRQIISYDVDPDACASGDLGALTTLGVRSIMEMESTLNQRRRDRETAAPKEDSRIAKAESPVEAAPAPLMYKQMIDKLRVPLPSLRESPAANRSFAANQRSLRQCDTCSLAEVCPKHEPGSECSFDIPVEIATREDWLSACQVILDFQFQRVTFGHFSEQIEGGQITEKVGREMDRFMRLMSQVQSLQHTQEVVEDGVLSKHLRLMTGRGEQPAEEPVIDVEIAYDEVNTVE